MTEERRRSARLEDEKISLKLEGFDSITHTLNISLSGVYCKVDKEIPLMSRVKLMLMIPDAGSERGAPKNVEVSGIVVRQHPVIADGTVKHYDIAIFFEDLSDKDKEVISGYITRKRGQ